MILLDTSVLVAYLSRRDKFHAPASDLLPALLDKDVWLVEPVLQELFYVLSRYEGYQAAIEAVETMTSLFPVHALDLQDFGQMAFVMRQYADVEFDYADTAIMAVADRFAASAVATFDRRDFQIYRNRNGQSFPLLP